MRINVNLQQLEAFLHVAAKGNFRAAAQSLNVSQPALSRTVRLAEEMLGVRLFDRDTRHVEITAAGRELLPIARRIVGEFDDAFSELAQFLEGHSGHVRIAALPSLGVAVLPAAIAAFRAVRPEVEFSIFDASAQPLLAAINEGHADFGISVRPAPDKRFAYRHLLDDPFVLICRKDDPLAQQKVASWSACATRPFIASSPASSIRPVTDAVFVQKGIALRPAFECANSAIGGALVASGLGISAMPRLTLRLIDCTLLAAVPLVRPAAARQIGIVTRNGRSLSPAATAFIDSLIGPRPSAH